MSTHSLLRKVVRGYTMHSPLERGKGRLVEMTRKWTVPDHMITEKVGDSYIMELDLSDLIQRNIYFFGYYEPHFASALKQVLRPSDIFVDVGANVGQFSLIAAGAVGESGKVIAIEPEPNNFEQLKKNFQLNLLINSKAFNLAAGKQRGEVDLFVRGREGGFTNRGVHSLHKHEDWLNPQKVSAHIELLDTILADEPRVDVIKMDIEGAELGALEGAVHSIKRFDPIIFFEANEVCTKYFGHSTADVKLWLRGQGFSLARLTRGRLETAPDGPETDSMLVAYSSRRQDRLRTLWV
jgi:FkbM family methyltransferase